MANNSISGISLEEIKQNLITFLETKTEFDGFDFEGSNMSILLDLLSYNTYYQQFYVNMLSSEMFLETSQLRNSVVNHAKKLGYLPTSKRGSIARIKISVTDTTSPQSIVLPKYTKLKTEFNGIAYPYFTTDSFILSNIPGTNRYESENIFIKQGKLFNHTFNSVNDIILPNSDIDTETISVKVFENNSDTVGSIFTKASDLMNVNSTSNVYFINETDNLKYSITFGDGVLGASVSAPNIVEIRYATSFGSDSNGANIFTLTEDIGYNTFTITTLDNAATGSDIESVESIKYFSPKMYQSQNRLVTAKDYASAIQKEFPNFNSIKAWGGDENEPPAYGKVFISIKTAENSILSNSVKQLIIERLLDAKGIVSITAEIVDPEFIYININSEVKYNPKNSSKSLAEIKQGITDVISTFSSNTLEKFDENFRYSRLLALIDNADPSISNSTFSYTLSKRIIPRLNTFQSINVNFNNSIYRPNINYDGSINSSKFTYDGFSDCYLTDQDGRLKIIRKSINSIFILNDNVGTIDYTTGKLTINSLYITQFQGDYLEITVQPGTSDAESKNNQILLINDDTLSVNLIDINFPLINESNIAPIYSNL